MNTLRNIKVSSVWGIRKIPGASVHVYAVYVLAFVVIMQCIHQATRIVVYSIICILMLYMTTIPLFSLLYNTVEPPRTVTSQQLPPSYNSKLSISLSIV